MMKVSLFCAVTALLIENENWKSDALNRLEGLI